MKPAPFDYQAPGTLREAIDLLASNPEAVVIAGGQSLMPVLAFRLATPSLLVDLRRLPGLGNIAVGDDGLRLGSAPPSASPVGSPIAAPFVPHNILISKP
jgi:aerobic carbon-monoxide dehydrogenase medium subunit